MQIYFNLYERQGFIIPIRIFIDQGHNPSGFNTGATGNGLFEQDITYEVGNYLNNLLNANPEFDSRVSRTTPSERLGYNNQTSLSERVRLAREWGADYFISIHTNASLNPQGNGTEVYVYSRYGEAYNLANDVLEEIVERMDMTNRGVKIDKTLYVLRKTPMPAILIELGFITNSGDAAKMQNNPYGFAYAIYEGILKYFDLD